MKVFILGGTGAIGTHIVRELIARSHQVSALSRSNISDRKLEELGAVPLRGDMQSPELWAESAIRQDAIIQVAATFDDNMGEVDAMAVDAIVKASANAPHKPRMLYTGGCWLYGETGETIATEEHPFNPIPAFDWMVVNSGELLIGCENLSTVIIHPAMVYDPTGGVFERMLNAAMHDEPLEIWGSPATHWPLVEASDLARAYCDLLTRKDLTGHFNVSAQTGVRVLDIVNCFKAAYSNLHTPVIRRVDSLVKEFGQWAIGPTLDQQMSSEKIRVATGWRPRFKDYRTSEVFHQTRF